MKITLNIEPVGNPTTFDHFYTDLTSALNGTEYVLSGDENFNLGFSNPVFAFAMDYADDSANSIFTLTFFNGVSNVGTTSFTSTSPFTTAKLLGFASDMSFDRVEFREADGATNSNEYFQFYTVAASSVAPEPSSLALFRMGAIDFADEGSDQPKSLK